MVMVGLLRISVDLLLDELLGKHRLLLSSL